MSKAVLISIRPKWCELIASGKKTIEVRKTRPQIKTPFKCYIYQTLPKSGDWNDRDGHVIGEFVCDRITDIHLTDEGYDFDVPKMTCLKYEEMEAYLDRKNGYGWHISNLVIYDAPKELSEFMKPCNPDPDGTPPCLQCKRLVENYGCGGTILRPPMSWCYVEELP